MRIDPRLRVLYLLSAAIGVFFLHDIWLIAALCLAQAFAWPLVGLPMDRLARQLWKLLPFSAFIIASYGLFGSDDVSWRRPAFDLDEALLGVRMVLRLLMVVMASQLARAGDPRAVAAGLQKLWVPRMAAISVDAVLALLGSGPGSGRGGGGGGGRGRGGEPAGESFWAAVKRIGRGDVGPLVHRLERQIARAEEHVEQQGGGALGKRLARDVAVIAGVSLTMLGIKALKILPGIPFAPGYKIVVLTPLYIVASLLTRTRWGATLTGLTMGTVAFLMGDGKYGIFEIAKHVTPGLVCDALVPAMTRGNRMPGRIGWSLFGGLVGAARFMTIICVVLLVQPPKIAYALLLPGLTVHVTFGAASGWVSYHVVRAVARLREEYQLADKELA